MKKVKMTLFIFLIVILLTKFGFADTQNEVYVIPIKGEINKASYGFLKESIDKAYNEGADAIIFEIDTYGGLIDQAESIKNLIISSPIPTISYVNNKAESAGVLITIAAEKVVMSKTATIGSAETIPNTEKILSMWRSLLRDVAQFRGRDYEIIEAMADKDIAIDGIIEKGKLINLTSEEAVAYGIADLAADDYNEILQYFNLANAKITNINESFQMKLTKYISSPYISSLLLSLGFVGLVVEILTPGFGIGGTVSIISFGLYFGGNILAGHSQWTSLALFVTGLVLLVIAGIIPGFGLPEISGIVLVLVGTVLAMDSLSVALVSLSTAIIITTITTIVLMKLGFRSKMFNKIVLNTNHQSEKGYLSSDSKSEYLDKEGISLTELRPAGFIIIDEIKLDALSEDGFISRDTPIIVARVEGSKIFVRRV